VIVVRGFFRVTDPCGGGESQQTMTPKFDFVLRADTEDVEGGVARSLTCDNCGWVVEVCDANLATCRIDAKEWKRKVQEQARQKISVPHFTISYIFTRTSRNMQNWSVCSVP